MKYSILFAFIFSLILTSAGFSQNDGPAAAVDKIFSWTKPNEPGCSAAVMKDGKLVVDRAYGSADLERSVPISSSTRFDAGSIRKQFVAAGILQLVEEGKLSLTDDIRKHIPELPDYGHKITLDHLLTHTSGIRDWQPLLNLAGGDPDAMTMILRQRELNFAPGDEWSYSNSGYVLLPEVIRRVSGMPFSEYAQKHIFKPLGMNSVYAEDPNTLIPDRALAYDKEDGRWHLDMYMGNDRGGAGALYTSAADLALWNDALMNGRLGTYVTQKLVEPTVLNNGRKLSYTRGLFVELKPGRGGQLVWHSGGAAGYSARAGYLADHKLVVVTMCNLDGGSKSEYASGLFALYLPPDDGPKAAEPPATVETGDLKSLAGTYFDEKDGRLLQLMVNKAGILGIAGGGPLVPIAEKQFRLPNQSLFFMSEAEVELRFLSDGRFELKTADGEVRHFRRAKSWSPSDDDIKKYAGSFYSDELMSKFEATPVKGGLMVRVNDSPKAVLTFRPVEEGVFQVGMSLLRFVRDGDGNVVGLEYTNPVLRKVKFVRAGQGGAR